MLDSVVTSLNATVAKFVARNPSFTVQLLLATLHHAQLKHLRLPMPSPALCSPSRRAGSWE